MKKTFTYQYSTDGTPEPPEGVPPSMHALTNSSLANDRFSHFPTQFNPVNESNSQFEYSQRGGESQYPVPLSPEWSRPVPVVLCGMTTQVAEGVIAALRPEYEVIHLVLTPEIGASVIPALLCGYSAPTEFSTPLGTANYVSPPQAIILGRGYTDDKIAIMQNACYHARAPDVPWLRADMTKPTPPPGPAYGQALVTRVKDLMAWLIGERRLGTGEGGTFWY